MTRLPRRLKKDVKTWLAGGKPASTRLRRWARRASLIIRRRESEPHIVGTDAPTPENDPIGRFRS